MGLRKQSLVLRHNAPPSTFRGHMSVWSSSKRCTVLNSGSHISSVGLKDGNGKVIKLEEELLSSDASVAAVIASSRNQLGKSKYLFPAHGGRGFLREQGFGGVNIQSLLVLGGF